jgi:hypothetical protein
MGALYMTGLHMHRINDHFPDVGKMVEIPSNREKTKAILVFLTSGKPKKLKSQKTLMLDE